MPLHLSDHTKGTLLRGAAAIALSALAAGCSSSVSRFQDSLFTGTSLRQQASVPASQPYPGDTAAQLDQIYTGTVPTVATRSHPVPTASVGGGGLLAPRSTVAASQPQPSYAAPQPAYRDPSNVSRAALPAPSAPQAQPRTAQVGQTTTQSAAMVPAGTPQPSPSENGSTQVAVLPQQPKVAQEQPASSTDGNAARGEGGGNRYTVVAGDTLSAISRRTGVSTDAIKRANGLDSGLIRIGQSLVIPTSDGGNVQVASAAPTQPAPAPAEQPVKAQKPQDTGSDGAATVAAYTPPSAGAEAVEAAVATTDVEAPESTGVAKMRWPVRGRVVSAFGTSGSSDGIDISVPAGTPIKAAENGVVIYAGDGLKEFGNTVLLRHDDGLVTVYGHTDEIKVSRGEKVVRGQEIASSGMSGDTDRPKLHFEVRKDSTPVDPAEFLE